MISSIINIYSKPIKPIILNNCVLIINPTFSININKVYVFNEQSLSSIYQNGNPFPIGFVKGSISVCGYFELSSIDFMMHYLSNQGKNDYIIESFIGDTKYCFLERVAISKVKEINTDSIKIKFIAGSMFYNL